MSAPVILLHGDDGFGLDLALREFAVEVDATERIEILPDRSPDETALDRARLEAGTMSMFGAHLTVLRQPLKVAGRSTSAADRLLRLVHDLPDGSALALVEERPSRDITKPPALLKRLADAVRERGGRIEEHGAPRRGELRGWITAHAARERARPLITRPELPGPSIAPAVNRARGAQRAGVSVPAGHRGQLDHAEQRFLDVTRGERERQREHA